MKRKLAVRHFVAVVLGVAMATGAIAQVRHDERPHGEGAKHVTKSKVTKQPRSTGARHDERPHGQPPKTEAEKK